MQLLESLVDGINHLSNAFRRNWTKYLKCHCWTETKMRCMYRAWRTSISSCRLQCVLCLLYSVHVHHGILNELMLSLNLEHSPIREREKSNDIGPNEEYLFGWCVGGATKTFGSVPVERECKWRFCRAKQMKFKWHTVESAEHIFQFNERYLHR